MESFIDVSGLTYSGKEGQAIFSKDIYGIDLRSYGITFLDGLKGKQKIYSGEMGEAFQAYTCPFTPQGAVSLAEAFIEPAALKVNMEECYDKFWSTYLVEQTSITLNGGIPQTFGDWYFAKLREEMSKEYQEIFWKGDTSYSGATKKYIKVLDGVEKLLSGATQVSGASMTVDNILGQVEATINAGVAAAATADISTEDFKVFMNYSDVRLLQMALGKVCCPNSQSIFSNYAKGTNGEIYIFGYQVVPTMQSRNVIIFGPARNLVLGFDTYDSHIQYKLIDLRDTTGDNAFRVLAITNIGVSVVFPEAFTISKP